MVFSTDCGVPAVVGYLLLVMVFPLIMAPLLLASPDFPDDCCNAVGRVSDPDPHGSALI